MSLDPRFSIVTSEQPDGSWAVTVTDYAAFHGEKRFNFTSRAAAYAEGKQMCLARRYGTGAAMARGGVA